jgi:hypothetical protein
MVDPRVTIDELSPIECILLEYIRSCYHVFCSDFGEPSLVMVQVPIRYPLFRYLFNASDEVQAAYASLPKKMDLRQLPHATNVALDGIWPRIHDFVRRNCLDIVARIPCEAIVDIARSTTVDKIVRILNRRLTFEHKATLEEAVRVSESYGNVINAGDGDRVLLEKQFMQDFGARTDIAGRAMKIECLPEDVAMFRYRGDGIVPNRTVNLAFVIVNGVRDPDEELRRLKKVLTQIHDDVLVALVLGNDTEIRLPMQEAMLRKRAVSLNATVIKEVVLARDPLEALAKHIISRLPPAALSPYKTQGPVTGDVFFGRQSEIRRIIETPRTQYAIVGARRIGKTSLLLALRDRVNNSRQPDNMIAVYIDACMDKNVSSFQEHITRELCKETESRPRTFTWIDPGPSFFHDLRHNLRDTGYKFLILVDEIDAILGSRDGDAALLTFIRSAANEGYVRFVCAGYKTLYDRLQDRSSALYNLFETIALGPLKQAEAEDLVRMPMSHIHVDVANNSILHLILERASTFPWLLQAMCNLLLEALGDGHERRTISAEDVQRVYESKDFTDCLTGWIRERHDHDGTILDLLIIYLMARASIDIVQEEEIYGMLSSVIYPPHLSSMRQSLGYLTATYVLASDSNKYRFSLPQIKKRLRDTEDLDSVIHRLTIDYDEELRP